MTFRRRRPPVAVEPERDDAQPSAGTTGGRGAAAAPRPRRAADRCGARPIQRARPGSRTSRRARYHGHAAVLVEEAVERHVRRAVRGERQRPDRRVHRAAAHRAGHACDPARRWRRAGHRRRCQRTGPPRCRAHRLRRQHQPRVEDPGRRARRAGRGAGRHRRSRSPLDGSPRRWSARRTAPREPSTICWSCREPSSAALRRKMSCRRRPGVDDAVARAQAAAEQHSIKVIVHNGPGDLHVVGSHRQLVSAVANLLENAVKYSDTGSEVIVESRRDNGWIEIVVTDTGVGIPARDIDRIFERFYRVDRARSRDTGGTGLGLSIVRHVATNHSGEVTVQSREGEGSVFTIRSLPCRRQHDAATCRSRRRGRAELRRGLDHRADPRGLPRRLGRPTGSRPCSASTRCSPTSCCST